MAVVSFWSSLLTEPAFVRVRTTVTPYLTASHRREITNGNPYLSDIIVLLILKCHQNKAIKCFCEPPCFRTNRMTIDVRGVIVFLLVGKVDQRRWRHTACRIFSVPVSLAYLATHLALMKLTHCTSGDLHGRATWKDGKG
jgi:hypothetical protein